MANFSGDSPRTPAAVATAAVVAGGIAVAEIAATVRAVRLAWVGGGVLGSPARPIDRWIVAHPLVIGSSCAASDLLAALLACGLAVGFVRRWRWSQPIGIAFAAAEMGGLIAFPWLGPFALLESAAGAVLFFCLLSASGVGWFAPPAWGASGAGARGPGPDRARG